MEGHLKKRPLQYPEAPRFSRRISVGSFQYLATAANAFDHAVQRRVLAIDWIVRISHQVFLRGHLISTRLAVADRCLRQQLLVRVRRWRWCGWISRTNRLRNRRRSVDQGQQRYRRDQLSHDGSPEGAPFRIHGCGETRPQGAQTSRFVQMFQARWRAQGSETVFRDITADGQNSHQRPSYESC